MKTAPRIVLVDDDILQLSHYERILAAEGYEISKYINAHEAIDGIDETIDVVIVDLLLGYNTVFPLLNEIQSQDALSDIPIIVCSNISETLEEETLSAYGVRKMLDKSSMHPLDLIAAVRSVL
jgi:PleD family two-component response regulator